jgi:hypothetical protein
MKGGDEWMSDLTITLLALAIVLLAARTSE